MEDNLDQEMTEITELRHHSISFAQILSRFLSLPSRPGALFSFIIDNRLRIPALDTVILGMGFG